MQPLCERASAHQNFENDNSNEVFCFDESLRELKDLRTQLHFAADSCETIFLKSEDKREMVENTKEYICRALVTLVDHLGNVSSKLDRLISIPNHFSDVELRIHCLQQRIMSSQQHVQKLAMYKLRWRENLPIYQTCYLPTVTLTDAENSKGDPRRNIYSSNKYIRSGKIPNFVHASTSVDEPSPYSKIVFSREMAMHKELSLLLPTKTPNPTFPFQLVPPKLDRSRSLNRRSSSPTLLGSDILSLIRRRVRKGNAKS